MTIYRFPVRWTERLLFLLLLAVWLVRPPFLGAQVQVREATQVQEIHVELVVSLGDEDGPGTVGRPAAVERRSNGEWVLTDAHNPEFVKFFTSQGTWLRTLGRRGDGPGEFRQAWFLQMVPEDSLAVFDYGSGRLTVFTPDLQVARITPLRVPATRMALLPDGRIVVAALVMTRESAGLPLHLVDSQGRLERSFGADPPIQDASDFQQMSRKLAVGTGSTIWVAHLNHYAVEEWSVSGERLRRFERSVPWFRPGGHYGRPRDRDGPPGPGIAGIHVDLAGRIWIAVHVPDSQWQRALVSGQGPYGRPRQMIQHYDRYWDTRLEVLDPETGTVIASTVLDHYVQGFTSSGDLITYRFREGMIPTAEIFQARLINPRGGYQ
jgi:hypothetical protein